MQQVIDAALETIGPVVEERGHRLDVDLPSEPLGVFGDPVRLTQVVTNLVHNAAKYTPKPGVIRVHAHAEADTAVIRVEDEGIGMSPAALRTVFDAFGPGEAPAGIQRGLGLGLILIKSIVIMHGGSVSAHSEGPGRGSQFEVRLPLHAATTSSEAGGASLPPASASARVLVVDDNHDVAETMAVLLRLLGHEVAVAHEGARAVELGRVFRPEVVFLDLGLPDMSGYEVAQRLRAAPADSEMRLVAVTGWGQVEDRQRTRAAGFDHHLTKPTTLDELSAVFAQVRADRDATTVTAPRRSHATRSREGR
jgi:CheY-like chemotaxis protein